MEAISFDDLDDPSFVPTGKTARDLAKTDVGSGISLGSGRSSILNVNQVAQFKCDKCRGSGRFIGYTGRDFGPCHKCKGTGKLKTDPELLAARRKARAQAQQERAATEIAAWIESHPAENAWIVANAPRFDFAASMAQALAKYHSLTIGQLGAIQKCIARDAERAAQRAAQAESAPKVDGEGFSRMIAAFATAKASRLKYPKFRVGPHTFKPASANSKNAGSIYVTKGSTYLGKITSDGRFVKVYDCIAEDEAEVIRICKDPLAAAVLHGKQTGQCACCGRELENKESVELGIGPICRQKWGL